MTASFFAHLENGDCPQLLEQFILKNKINVNNCWNDDRNLLMIKSELGHVGCVVKLIELGADVNIHSSVDGYTALIGAARGNHVEVVILLLKIGANANHVDMFGLTALGWAEACGCKETAALLRDASGCPLWSTSMVTEMLRSITSSTDTEKSKTTERDSTWLGCWLAQRGVSPDHVALCEAVLIQQEGFCTSEVFASTPASVLTRAYFSSVGIHALGVQQVLLQLHSELPRGLASNEMLHRDDPDSSWSSYTGSESTSNIDSSDITSCLEEVQSRGDYSGDDSASTSTTSNSTGGSTSSTSSRSSSHKYPVSESDSSSSDNYSSNNSDEAIHTNSNNADDSDDNSDNEHYAQSSDPSTSNNATCTSTGSTTDTSATTSTTTTATPTKNTAYESGTADPVTSSCCACLCFFCPAGRQIALSTVHATLVEHHVVILVCLVCTGVGLVVGYTCSAQAMLRMIYLLLFLLMVMVNVAAEVYD